MNRTSRREMLGTIGLTAGAGLAAGCGGAVQSQTPSPPPKAVAWQYKPLSPAAVAADAYRIMPEGGCMYGLFAAVLSAWSKETAQPLDGFPFHMFRYGEGGIGGWGSVCGALNAGAALFGLFECDKKRREQLVTDLFSWYEQTELPTFRPSEDGSVKIAKSVAGSVLCHISVAHWCKASGAAPLSKEMKHRCRCLTADVAAKTVELLNHHRDSANLPAQAEAKPPAPKEPPQALGKMRCDACHKEE
jgi:hypothetical protein